MQAPLPIRACPSCAATAATPLDTYSSDGWHIVQCAACAFVYLQNPPPYEALEEDLSWEKTSAAKKLKGGSTPLSGLNRKIRAMFGHKSGQRAARRYAGWFGAGPVLDIGCGKFVRTRPPMVPYGIELSREGHAIADAEMRALGGYCLQAPGAVGVWEFPAAMFNGVIMSSYLEHEVDVRRALDGVFRTLKPGGKAYVRIPNYASLNRRVIGPKWCGFRSPDHVNYFTLASLREIAKKSGFETRLVNWLGLWIDDNIHALLIKPMGGTA
jgi:SAM-dependent methyltransferase